MIIHWDHDNEEWDPFTILGSINLQGDVSGRIQGDCLILDTWFVSLGRGLLEIRSGKQSAFVDTIDEPDEIYLSTDGDQLTIRWIDQHLEVSSLDTACTSVAAQLSALADDLATRPPPRDEQSIYELRQLADRLSGGP